jgi:hypothetical protein
LWIILPCLLIIQLCRWVEFRRNHRYDFLPGSFRSWETLLQII